MGFIDLLRRAALLNATSGCLMKRLSNALLRFARDEQGTETLEWGLVCGLIVVGAIAAIALIGPKVTAMWTNINSKIP